MKKQKDSTASSRGSRRVAAKCPTEDGYRDVRGAQMPTGLAGELVLQEWRIKVHRGVIEKVASQLKSIEEELAKLRKRVIEAEDRASGAANGGGERPTP